MTALCQCTRCERYLTRNRTEFTFQICEACAVELGKVVDMPSGEPIIEGIPLAKIRGTLTDPLKLELLSLLGEECGEVVQRKEKIVRWGLDADFEGTTQTHKLETELGDILAALDLLDYNGLVSIDRVLQRKREKMHKFREDAAGPRQRLLHARVPEEE